MDAIASIFVNYHEERRELVEKTEAADLIEQNVAELMQLCYRGASAGESRLARRVASFHWGNLPVAASRTLPGTVGAAARRVAALEPRSRRTSQIADEGGPATHQLVAATLLIQFVVLPRKMGTGRDSLETDENVVTCFIDGAATLKRARKQGLLRPVAPRPLSAAGADVVASERLRSPSRGPRHGPLELRDPSESIPDDLDPVTRRLHATAASSRRPRSRVAARSCSMDRALKIFSDSAGLYPMVRLLARPSRSRPSTRVF
ncbi:hypothetical protein JL720_2558 [Aureococcus anophagefferens]|nr:hypothetical protein JL720_2558 [Aureococcus anophagefferens]